MIFLETKTESYFYFFLETKIIRKSKYPNPREHLLLQSLLKLFENIIEILNPLEGLSETLPGS